MTRFVFTGAIEKDAKGRVYRVVDPDATHISRRDIELRENVATRYVHFAHAGDTINAPLDSGYPMKVPEGGCVPVFTLYLKDAEGADIVDTYPALHLGAHPHPWTMEDIGERYTAFGGEGIQPNGDIPFIPKPKPVEFVSTPINIAVQRVLPDGTTALQKIRAGGAFRIEHDRHNHLHLAGGVNPEALKQAWHIWHKPKGYPSSRLPGHRPLHIPGLEMLEKLIRH